MQEKINRIKIYHTALSFKGVDASPHDEAPDEYGCADSVSKVLKKAIPDCIRGSVSTRTLYLQLEASPFFKRAKTQYMPGDIIISPTGMGNGKMANGHVGIISEKDKIMSNSSATGTWEENYTMTSWVKKYRTKGGFPIYIYKAK